MFIVLLHYVRPLAAVEEFLKEHREFLGRHYAAGHFLASGARMPRTGGVILANGLNRDELDAVLAEDPFHREKIAEYQVIAFSPTMYAESFKACLQHKG